MLKQSERRILMGVVLAVSLSVSSHAPVVAADNAPASKTETPQGSRAIIKTKFGDIEIKFYPDVAPRHVENFIKLAKSGFYN